MPIKEEAFPYALEIEATRRRIERLDETMACALASDEPMVQKVIDDAKARLSFVLFLARAQASSVSAAEDRRAEGMGVLDGWASRNRP